MFVRYTSDYRHCPAWLHNNYSTILFVPQPSKFIIPKYSLIYCQALHFRNHWQIFRMWYHDCCTMKCICRVFLLQESQVCSQCSPASCSVPVSSSSLGVMFLTSSEWNLCCHVRCRITYCLLLGTPTKPHEDGGIVFVTWLCVAITQNTTAWKIFMDCSFLACILHAASSIFQVLQ